MCVLYMLLHEISVSIGLYSLLSIYVSSFVS